MADNRNRNNVYFGAPDVSAAGGIEIGNPATEQAHFPVTVSSDLAVLKLKPAGYVSEDGVTKTVDRSTEKVKDWFKDVVEVVESDHSVSLKLKFMEFGNGDVLKMIAGEGNVKIENGRITVIDNGDELPHRSIRITLNGGREGKIVVFAPDVKVSSVGDVQMKKGEVLTYEVTMECFGVLGKKLVTIIERAGIKADDAAPKGPGA